VDESIAIFRGASGSAFCTALVTGIPFPLNGLIDFLTVDRDFRRGLDPQPDFVATNVDDRNHNVITNDNALIPMPGKDQHLPDSFCENDRSWRLLMNWVGVPETLLLAALLRGLPELRNRLDNLLIVDWAS
jgi:hypothetical protein